MSGRMNSADHVVAHALGALVSGWHRPTQEVAMFVGVVRTALPHTNALATIMHELIPVATRLIEMPADWHDGSGGWPVWRADAQRAVVAFHRHALGAAQERMHEALQRRVAWWRTRWLHCGIMPATCVRKP